MPLMSELVPEAQSRLAAAPQIQQLGFEAPALGGQGDQAALSAPTLMAQAAASPVPDVPTASQLTPGPGIGFDEKTGISRGMPSLLEGYVPPGHPNSNLTLNPQLPKHPLDAATDAEFEAQDALLRHEFTQRYMDLMQQLGYTDPNNPNNRIMGLMEVEAQRRRRELDVGYQDASRGVIEEAQRGGTLFSGRRAKEQARAQRPFVQGLSDLDVDVGRGLSQLVQDANGLISEYQLRQALLLLDAAKRVQANAPRGTVPSGGGGGGSGSGSGDGSTTGGHSMVGDNFVNDEERLDELWRNIQGPGAGSEHYVAL